MGINSCLYQIKVWHDRHQPKRYQFKHDIFMFYLDLDEVDQLPNKFSWIGHQQQRIYDFREEDHISLGEPTLKENILSYIKKQGYDLEINKIYLLTNLRVLGYVFNPVSFYYCFDKNGNSICAVVEIGNTFKELKYYFLSPMTKKAQGFTHQEVKYYYISPFTELDNTLDFNVQVPGDDLRIDIDVLKEGKKFFYSGMKGKKIPLSASNIWRMTIMFPFITLKVIVLIHWHAFVLALVKRLGFHAKDEAKDLQQNVYRSWKNTSNTMKE